MDLYRYRAKVLDVVDGDTIYFAIDMGLETTRIIDVRLYGINCPELHDIPVGPWAKTYTQEWLAQHATPEGWLLVQTIKDKAGTKDKKEKYGRYLAIVYDGESGMLCLNDDLVTDGHAVHKAY